jgi:hypothetical protein
MDSPSDKEAEELDKTTDTTTDQQTEESSTSDTDQTTEDSSNPQTSEDDASTFDIVMNAIKPEEDEDEDEDSSEEDESEKSEEGDKKSDDDDTDKEVSDDDFEDFTPEERAKLKKATAERFDKLKGLYRESKEKVEELSGELEQSSVEAGYYKQFVGFLEENRLSQEEANNLFNIGALMKNDPQKALEAMTPYYNELLQITGNVLPPDLQQQVQQGTITKENAFEMSRLRMTKQTTQAINEDRQTHQQDRDTRHQNDQVVSMQTALADWEKTWSSSDPDYAKKKSRVLDRVELMLVRASRNNTLPKTKQEAVELAEKAKTEIEADFNQFKPRKKVNTVDGGSTTSNLPEPKDTKDVIRRALNQ